MGLTRLVQGLLERTGWRLPAYAEVVRAVQRGQHAGELSHVLGVMPTAIQHQLQRWAQA